MSRYALNFKGLVHKTEWVEYPDIEALCKKIGADSTTTHADGSPYYTLPAIFDPNTSTGVADSAAIVRYLDKTYPETPRLIYPETDALQRVFDFAFEGLIVPKLGVFMIPLSNSQLNPSSEAYFRRTREAKSGKKLEEWSPAGSELQREHWAALEAALGKLAGFYASGQDGQETVFVMGDRVSYADFIVAGWLVWARRVLGPTSAEWKTIASWHDGKWEKLLKAIERYEVVV